MKYLILLLFIPLTWSCSTEKKVEVVTYTLAREDFEVAVNADGICRALNATPIAVPSNLRAALSIAWLAEEGSIVEEGDVLIRFDEGSLDQDEANYRNKMTEIDFDYQMETRNSRMATDNMTDQVELTRNRREMAERFAARDERLYSREEIIESEVNQRFLGEKLNFLETNLDRQEQKTVTSAEINTLEKKRYQVSLERIGETRQYVVMRAPHRGVFYLKKSWGKPFRVGDMMWRGVVIGELPDISVMEADVHVLEADAAGLKPGLKVEAVLDARPNHVYTGTVKTVGALAGPKDEGSPVKFFKVAVAFDTTDQNVMRPGAFVSTRIIIDRAEQVLTLPNQALFTDQDGSWVWRKTGDGFEKVSVTPGKRGPTRTVIDAGLEAGDQIALSDVEIGQ